MSYVFWLLSAGTHCQDDVSTDGLRRRREQLAPARGKGMSTVNLVSRVLETVGG
jgi:hypothetical protein